MRTELKKLGDKERFVFTGVVERYGKKNYGIHTSTTILLKDIKVDGNDTVLTDHIWLNVGKQLFEVGNLKQGDILEFKARVKDYSKVNRDFSFTFFEKDFKLDRPNNFRVLNREVPNRVYKKELTY